MFVHCVSDLAFEVASCACAFYGVGATQGRHPPKRHTDVRNHQNTNSVNAPIVTHKEAVGRACWTSEPRFLNRVQTIADPSSTMEATITPHSSPLIITLTGSLDDVIGHTINTPHDSEGIRTPAGRAQ